MSGGAMLTSLQIFDVTWKMRWGHHDHFHYSLKSFISFYIWKWWNCCRSNQPGGERNGKPDLFPALEAKLPDDPKPRGHYRGQVISLKDFKKYINIWSFLLINSLTKRLIQMEWSPRDGGCRKQVCSRPRYSSRRNSLRGHDPSIPSIPSLNIAFTYTVSFIRC